MHPRVRRFFCRLLPKGVSHGFYRKETESNLKSSQQHYKNQMTELNKVNLKLQTEIDKLTKKNKKNDKDLGEYKTKINELNQKIFQLQSQLNQ